MHDDIQQYLDKALSKEQEQAFEKRLDAEPPLAKLLEEELLARTAVLATGRENHRENLKARYREAKPAGRVMYMRMVMTMASVAAGLLLVVWLLGAFDAGKADPAKLYASNYEPQVLSGLRSQDGSAYASWKQAAALYNKADYAAAIPYLEAALADSAFKESAKARFFLGMSHLESGQFAQAIEAFGQVPAGSAFEERAQWFIAMTYLRQADIASAKMTFETIAVSDSHFKQAEAREVLEVLE